MFDPLVISSRMPPPSSLEMLVEMTFRSIVAGPVPGDSWVGRGGSSPAIMMPPPSSYDPLNQTRLPRKTPPALPWYPNAVAAPPYSAEKLPQIALSVTAYPSLPAKIPMPPARLLPPLSRIWLRVRLRLVLPPFRYGVPTRTPPP